MDPFGPHPSAAFEGYYSKFTLPSGSHIVLILCTVRNAPTRPHMLSFTYIPYRAPHDRVFQREIWADHLHMTGTPSSHNTSPFSVDILDTAYLHAKSPDVVTWSVSNPDLDFSFSATTSSRTPWVPNAPSSTPAGLLAYLPLPLQWHVQSRASTCTYALRLPPSFKPLPGDDGGVATAHLEKNWGTSFPRSHVWIQAWDSLTKRGFCCAGGRILGMDAYLLSYVNTTTNLTANFRPPWTLSIWGWAPFSRVVTDWDARAMSVSVSGWRQRIEARVQAPEGTFFELSAPFGDGHRLKSLAESFEGVLQVEVYERTWWGTWRLVQEDRFEDAAVEFAGDSYPLRGGENHKTK